MIHLDTNYIIGLLVKGSAHAAKVDQWLASGELLGLSAVVWTEFLNGPVTSTEITRATMVVQSRIVSFGEQEAVLAAKLFNDSGRRRGSRFDCLIAATAIAADASLATSNHQDFKVFSPFGLRLES